MSARLFLLAREFSCRASTTAGRIPGFRSHRARDSTDTRAYEVVFAIVTSAAPPIGPTLPFFARNFLARVVPDIESMGYRVTLANVEEQLGARPSDAGQLFRDRTRDRQPFVQVRSSPRSRRARRMGRETGTLEEVAPPTTE